jgi:hypothetical protein
LGQDESYIGSIEQNLKLFKLRPEVKGTSFKNRKKAWREEFSFKIDFSYQFPFTDFENDPSAQYWKTQWEAKNEVEESEKTKYFKYIESQTLKKLKGEVEDLSVVSRVRAGLYNFSAEANPNLKKQVKEVVYENFIAEKVTDNAVKELMANIIRHKNTLRDPGGSGYYFNHVVHSQNGTAYAAGDADDDWYNDIHFEREVRRILITLMNNEIYERFRRGLLHSDDIETVGCDKNSYYLKIQQNGLIQLSDENKNTVTGEIISASKTECTIKFNSNNISKAKIKLLENGAVSKILLDRKCGEMNDYIHVYVDEFYKGFLTPKAKSKLNRYVKVNEGRYYNRGSLGEVFIDLNSTFKSKYSKELFPIVYKVSRARDPKYETGYKDEFIVQTYGYIDISSIYWKFSTRKKNMGQNSLAHIIYAPHIDDISYFNIPYKEIKIPNKNDRKDKDWTTLKVVSEVLGYEPSQQLGVIPKDKILSIESDIEYLLKFGYYIKEKGMSQNEINTLINKYIIINSKSVQNQSNKDCSTLTSYCLVIIGLTAVIL